MDLLSLASKDLQIRPRAPSPGGLGDSGEEVRSDAGASATAPHPCESLRVESQTDEATK